MKMKPQCPYRVMKSRFHLEDYLSCLACNDLEKKKTKPKNIGVKIQLATQPHESRAVRGSLTERPQPGRRGCACPAPGTCHRPAGDLGSAGRAPTKPPSDADANRALPAHAAAPRVAPNITGTRRPSAPPSSPGAGGDKSSRAILGQVMQEGLHPTDPERGRARTAGTAPSLWDRGRAPTAGTAPSPQGRASGSCVSAFPIITWASLCPPRNRVPLS